MSINVIYKTSATATGGRDGAARSDDGSVDVKLVVPKEMGGPGGDGANPEKLFAAGYSACFLGALKAVSGKEGVTVPADATVKAEIGFGPRSEGGFGITADLVVTLPGVEREAGERLLKAAHEVCPYSNATRGNVDVGLTLA
ncbi:organic hydroperoxide resistance protein [Sphingomonas solaris]|uniref:Organic hydroperoxide resistance protein n=1 Tax=Alterirhizorhabdus solaris TaxID=2529389 RepID=A0A558RA92_9SPHN|nr:organic hydroperoxide resistance protein [Sphingomonas solaris]TVV76299.1 organic hydroperoxide resistance protein [Sphingomonas solaris]